MSEINWGEIWTLLLQMYLPTLIGFVVGGVFLLVKRHIAPILIKFWEQKLGDKERSIIEAVAREAVWAAEQIAKRDDVKEAAEYKLEVARTYVDTKLRRYGIRLSATEIYGMLESAVATELNRWKQPAPQAQVAVTVESAPSSNIVVEEVCENCPEKGCVDCPVRGKE